MRRQQLSQHIAGLQQYIDHLRLQGDLPGAHLIQQGFQHMGNGGEVIKAEHAAGALDRVGRAKNTVKGLCIGLGNIQRQQQMFQGGEMLFCFLEEHPKKLTHTKGHGYLPKSGISSGLSW